MPFHRCGLLYGARASKFYPCYSDVLTAADSSARMCLSFLSLLAVVFPLFTAPLMASLAEVAELKGELQSIEQLIEDLLQQQTELCSWLTSLESVGSQRPLALAAAATHADFTLSPLLGICS